MQIRFIPLMMAIIWFITACGQSGPLYLPPPEHPPVPGSIDHDIADGEGTDVGSDLSPNSEIVEGPVSDPPAP